MIKSALILFCLLAALTLASCSSRPASSCCCDFDHAGQCQAACQCQTIDRCCQTAEACPCLAACSCRE